MRLGCSRLRAVFTAVALAIPSAAQERTALPLPWETAPVVSWRAGLGSPADLDAPLDQGLSSSSKQGPIVVKLSADGTLHLIGAKGIRHLRLGLPGRPLRIWRDAGVPLALAGLEGTSGSWRFPKDTLLGKGIQALPWGSDDFRPALNGLLWILDDGEHFLTMVHPATARVVFLPLPIGQDFSLRVTAGYLELLEPPRKDASSAPRRWSLPWLALLPQFANLARPESTPAPGTALIPFPNN